MTADMSLSEASGLIAAGRLSPLELIDGLLMQIDRLDPLLNAFIALDRDGLRAAARRAGDEITRDGMSGPLHGLPFGVKDIIDVAGYATTCHSELRRTYHPTRDAQVITHMRMAGAIPMGKLATLEFAIGGPSFDLPFPPARNPWNPTHFTGGSSSGSGAAVAGRMLPAALGSDTGGSVRHPAAHCGLVGLKPSYGLVSNHGVFPLAQSMDQVGPMTRSVRCAAMMLEGMTGSPAGRFTNGLDGSLKGRRIGYVRHFHTVDLMADPDMAAALDAAADLMRDQGAMVVEVKLPPLAEFDSALRVILLSEAACVHEHDLSTRPQDFAAVTRRRLLTGLQFSATEYLAAQHLRTRLRRAVDSAMEGLDLLLCANSMDPVCEIDDKERLEYTYMRQARVPFNLTGQPAIALPIGRAASNGMPLSLQLVGRRMRDGDLLAAAHAFETRSGGPMTGPALACPVSTTPEPEITGETR